MEMYSRNKGIHNYLCINISEETYVSNLYQVKMLEENDICGLIHPVTENIEGRISLNYVVDGYKTFSEYVEHTNVNGKLFVHVMKRLCGCVEEISHYLLETNHLILDIDYMFLDETNDIHLVYAPGYNMDIRIQIKRLLEHMMRIFDSKDPEGIQQLYEVYNLVSNKNSDFQKVLNLVNNELEEAEYSETRNKKLEEEKEETGLLNTTLLSESLSDTKLLSVDDCLEDIKKEFNITLGQKLVLGLDAGAIITLVVRYIVFEHDIVSLYFAGILLVAFVLVFAYSFVEKEENPEDAMREYEMQHLVEKEHALVPLNDGSLSKYSLKNDKKCIVIGRGSKEADYRLISNEISRVHAYILVRNDGFYLQDQNSTNGTFLNASRLLPKEIRKINTGDIIAFANEEFFVS